MFQQGKGNTMFSGDSELYFLKTLIQTKAYISGVRNIISFLCIVFVLNIRLKCSLELSILLQNPFQQVFPDCGIWRASAACTNTSSIALPRHEYRCIPNNYRY